MIYNAKSDIGGTISSFNYRKKVAINHGGALTAYQVKLIVDHANTNMKTDFGDIRFNTDTGNYIPYWIETQVNDVSANVWIKADLVNGDTIIYMYYGNNSLTSASDTTNTFIREISGVVGAWDFNSNVTDASGQENNGSIIGSVTYVPGKFGTNGTNFDGGVSYINVGSGSSLRPTSTITISAWVYPAPTSNTYNYTIGRQGTYTGWVIQQSSTSSGLYQLVYGNGSSWQFSTALQLTLSTWNHLVMQKDGTNIRAFLNGVLISTTICSGNISYTTDAIYIGNGWSQSNDRTFKGVLENVRVFNTALTTQQVLDEYNNFGYVTANYPGKELIRQYSSPEPTYTTSAEQTITATYMSVVPRESPCRVGICVVDVNVTWTNNGESATFTPSIIVDSNTISLAPRSLPNGDTLITFPVQGLSVGNHTICPDPN